MKLLARRPRKSGPPRDVRKGKGAPGALFADGASEDLLFGTVPASGAEAAEENPGGEAPPRTEDAPAEPEDTDKAESVLQMSLREHLIELRGRLLRCVMAMLVGFIAMFYFAPFLRDLMLAPLKQVLPPGGTVTFINLTEPFMVDMRIALVAGIFAVSPYIFYQVWAFIAPGLYASERKYVVPVALCSAFFFIAGGAFCYFVAFRFAFSFLAWYGGESLKASITLANQFDLSLRLLLAFGCIFEMPLFSFFLARLGIVTAKRMRAWRKYAILVNFIVAAVITPPDIYSQLLMAIPLLLLYEFSILVAGAFGRSEDGAPSGGQAKAEGGSSGEQADGA